MNPPSNLGMSVVIAFKMKDQNDFGVETEASNDQINKMGCNR